jgi:xanthine dehydrogenase accessory factor
MKLFEEIRNSIMNGRELVAATVVSDRGSTPRSSGSKMVVYPDGAISGTIGGGSVEGDVIQRAKKLFETKTALIRSYSLTQTGKADDMDLVCGGRMHILLEHVACTKNNAEMYGLICAEIESSQPFFWVGKISDEKDEPIERAVVLKDQKWVGSLKKETALVSQLSEMQLKPAAQTAFFDINQQQYVVERIKPPEEVYIMGGGHVSKEIALLTKQVGFKTLVFDDRAEFADKRRFPGVEAVHICNNFARVFDDYQVSPGSYIVIVTRGHRFDKEVLAQALRTETAYIGMIGSKKKRESVYQGLLNEGYSKNELDAVHCPIGLSIEAETPAEIAVSIIAELIQYRAKRNKQT